MTENKRTFPWPEDEIVASYRSALDKKAQIKILADLNVCKVQDIRELLIEHGEDLPEVRRDLRVLKWTVQEETQLRQLAVEGKSAAEIAELMGRTRKSIEQKLSKMHISLRNQQPVMKKVLLESLPTGKNIVEQALTKGLEDIGDEVKEQAQEMAEEAGAVPITTELKEPQKVKLPPIQWNLKDLAEYKRLREDAVSGILLTVLFDTLYSTDLNANLETVFARFGIKLLDYLKER